MSLTVSEIREMINQKSNEIRNATPKKCIDCGCDLPQQSLICEPCEKVAAINHLRNLVNVDPRYASVLAAVEESEGQHVPHDGT